jgi:predicted aconitase
MKVMEEVPYVKGLDRWLGSELNEEACSYLKDFGAATASNGAVGLYHIEGLTPEAKEQGEALIREDAQVYVVDDEELRRVKESYPVVWKNPDAAPALCFVGCPHLSLTQMERWCADITEKLRQNGLDRVSVPTVFTASPAVIREAEKGTLAARLRSCGVVISYICPLMYMNNPLCKKKPVITCSNKLRTYTSARYYTEGEILDIITGKEGRT